MRLRRERLHRVIAACGVCLAVVSGASTLEASARPVAFPGADGTTLTGLIYEASNRPAPGVVLVHMLGRSKDEWAPFAERLQNAGLTVLTFDLRGHGQSGGDGAMLSAMVGDVQSAVGWLASRAGVRNGEVAVVGASLGANLAALAAVELSSVRALALLSPSLDYRGVRLDAATMKKLAAQPLWLAASAEDPYALRTLKELQVSGAEQRVSGVRGHGTRLLQADQALAETLVDWLRSRLIF